MMTGVGVIGLLIVIAIIVAMASISRRPAEDGVPRGFPWLLTLLTLAVVAGIVAFIVYQASPIDYVLEINVPSGKRFIGEVIVDGRPRIIKGERNATLEFNGKRISWVILIEDTVGEDTIEVRLIGGASGSSTSTWGARGYSERKFMGGGAMYTSVNEHEWRSAMIELKRGEGNPDSLLPGFSAPSNPAEENANPASEDESTPSPSDAAPDANGEAEAPAATQRLRPTLIDATQA